MIRGIILTILCVSTAVSAFDYGDGMDFSTDIFPFNNAEEIERFIGSVQNYEQMKFPEVTTNVESNVFTSKPKRKRRRKKKKRRKVLSGNNKINQIKGSVFPRQNTSKQADLRIPRQEMNKIQKFIENVCRTSKNRNSLDQCKNKTKKLRPRQSHLFPFFG